MPKYEPLTREEVISVIEGKSIASRVPLQIHMWVHPETFGDREPAVRQILADYPQDTQMVHLQMPTVFRGEKAGSARKLRWKKRLPSKTGGNWIPSLKISLPRTTRVCLTEYLRGIPDTDWDIGGTPFTNGIGRCGA